MTARVLLIAATAAALSTALTGVGWSEEMIPASDCAMCHDEVVPAYAAGVHGRAMSRQSNDLFERSCVTCHGPAEEHADDPSTENISRHPSPEACVECHTSSRISMDLATPAHIRHGVECLECHASGHTDGDADHMLSAEPRELCATCHQHERAAFRLPFAHRDGAEPFQCTACHSLHGDNRAGRLDLLGNGGACVDCHTEKTGPFVFPHPPVDRPGCVTCHQPHGSTNPRLLTRRSVTPLCLECHTNVPAFHDLGRSRYQNCQHCHAAVHGSNRDPRLFEE